MNRSRAILAALLAVAAFAVFFLVLLEADPERSDPVSDDAFLPAEDVPAEPVRSPSPGPSPGEEAVPPAPGAKAEAPPRPADANPGAPAFHPPGVFPWCGRVLDLETGRPVPGFALRFYTEVRTEGAFDVRPLPADLEIEIPFRDGTGEFRVDSLPFEPEKMDVRAEGYSTFSSPLRTFRGHAKPDRWLFRPGEPRTLFLERPGFVVRVLLRDPSGAPFPREGATVQAELLDAGDIEARREELEGSRDTAAALRLATHFKGEPDTEDSVRLHLLRAGRYRLTGEHILGTFEERTRELAPETGEVVLRVSAAAAGLRITGKSVPERQSAAGFWVEVDPSGAVSKKHFSASRGSTSLVGGYAPGRWTFLFLPVGGAGFRPWRVEVALEAGRWADLEFDYQPAAPFRGTVFDEGGFPAEGVEVEVRWIVDESGIPRPAEGSGRWWLESSNRQYQSTMSLDGAGLHLGVKCKTGKGGLFEFPGLAGVPSSLHVDAGTCGRHEMRVAGIPADPEVRLPFSLHARLLRLRMPAGHGYSYVSVSVFGHGFEIKSFRGAPPVLEFPVRGDPMRPIYLEVEATDGKSKRTATAALEVREGTTTFESDLELGPPGGIRLSLADAVSGEPISGSVTRSRGTLTLGVRGCDAGGVAFENVPAGEYEVLAWASGHEAETVHVCVAPGEVKDLGTIRLRRTVK
ncbi:MAG: hypothetical protein MUC63_01015 [Planctomycetes bacterium]|nr:hypothetical protein [Planctomycetota bacterium]